MNIDPTTGPGRASAPLARLADHRAARPAPRPATGDTAGITDEARRLLALRPTVEAATEVRAEQVEALRHAIASGHYQADDREVARRLLDRGF